MIRLLSITTLIVLSFGAGGCSSFKPYDYSANRPAESDAEREARQASEARTEQQRIIRCQTSGSSLPRGDCN